MTYSLRRFPGDTSYLSVDWGNPISPHPLNAATFRWYMALPQFPGTDNGILRDLAGVRDGLLGNNWDNTDYTQTDRPGGWAELNMNGSSEQITFEEGLDAFFEGDCSLSVWLKTPSRAGPEFVLDARLANNVGFNMRLTAADEVSYQWDNSDFDIAGHPNDVWVLEGFTHTKAGAIKFFRDGVHVATGSESETLSGATDWRFGARVFSSPTLWLQAEVDDIHLWNRELGVDEMYEYWERSMAFYPGLFNRMPQFKVVEEEDGPEVIHFRSQTAISVP